MLTGVQGITKTLQHYSVVGVLIRYKQSIPTFIVGGQWQSALLVFSPTVYRSVNLDCEWAFAAFAAVAATFYCLGR